MKKIPSLGEQEMDMLKYISEKAPISVRDAAAYFETEKKLARTTVMTVMERLRKKGFLNRARLDGVFKYSPKFQTTDVVSSKVSEFIEKTLGGSVGPLFTYFLSSSNLSSDEISQLKELASKLEQKKAV